MLRDMSSRTGGMSAVGSFSPLHEQGISIRKYRSRYLSLLFFIVTNLIQKSCICIFYFVNLLKSQADFLDFVYAGNTFVQQPKN